MSHSTPRLSTPHSHPPTHKKAERRMKHTAACARLVLLGLTLLGLTALSSAK